MNNTCVSNCDSSIFEITTLSECVNDCDILPYIYKNYENNKKYCESNESCKNKGKFIFKDECILECPKYFKSDSNNNCILDNNNTTNDNFISFNLSKNELINLTLKNLNEFLETGKIIKENDFYLEIFNENTLLKPLNGISDIDVKPCLNYLNIKKYIIIKIETLKNSSYYNNLEFQIYDKDGNKINIENCNENFIINLPINDRKVDINNYKTMYDEYNYDIYNKNDSFYNDYCSIYNEDKYDVIIKDRKEKYINFCEENNCEFVEFNLTTKKIKCKCNCNNIFNFNFDIDKKLNLNQSIPKKNNKIPTNIKIFTCWKNLKMINFVNNYGFSSSCSIIFMEITFMLGFLIKSKGIRNITKIINLNPPKKILSSNSFFSNSNIDKSQISTEKKLTSSKLKKRQKYNKIENIDNILFINSKSFQFKNFNSNFFSICLYKITIFRIFFSFNLYGLTFLKLFYYIFCLDVIFIINIILFTDDFISKRFISKNKKLISYDSIIISIISWIIFEIINHYFIKYCETIFMVLNTYYNKKKKSKKKISINKIYLRFFFIFILIIINSYYMIIYNIMFKYSIKYCFINFILVIIYNIIFGLFLSLIICIVIQLSIKLKSKYFYNIYLFLWTLY